MNIFMIVSETKMIQNRNFLIALPPTHTPIFVSLHPSDIKVSLSLSTTAKIYFYLPLSNLIDFQKMRC